MLGHLQMASVPLFKHKDSLGRTRAVFMDTLDDSLAV